MPITNKTLNKNTNNSQYDWDEFNKRVGNKTPNFYASTIEVPESNYDAGFTWIPNQTNIGEALNQTLNKEITKEEQLKLDNDNSPTAGSGNFIYLKN